MLLHLMRRFFHQNHNRERIEREKSRFTHLTEKKITEAKTQKNKLKKIVSYIEESTTKDIARAMGVL